MLTVKFCFEKNTDTYVDDRFASITGSDAQILIIVWQHFQCRTRQRLQKPLKEADFHYSVLSLFLSSLTNFSFFHCIVLSLFLSSLTDLSFFHYSVLSLFHL